MSISIKSVSRQAKTGAAYVACVLILLVIAGCDLSGVEGDSANFITFDGEAPGGGPLGFIGNTIPMVDSTIVIRVLVADTIAIRSGQGLPAGRGTAQVVWSVSGGSVEPDTSEIGGSGLAVTSWTLGTETNSQSISARLVGPGVPDASTSFQMGGQSSRNGIYPGPPRKIQLTPTIVEVREGSGATIQILELQDEYGNAWNLDLFNLSMRSSEPGIVRNELSGESITETARVRAEAGGTAVLTIQARGTLSSDYDFRSLTALTAVPVTVAPFLGFDAVAEQVSAGDDFACLVAGPGSEAVAGAVYCWGSGDESRLGNPDVAVSSLGAPKPEWAVRGLPAGVVVRKISSGRAHTCVALDDGSVYCWGANGSRQLGSFGDVPGANRALLDNPNAASVDETGFTDVTSGEAHTCALGNSGKVYCWGANAFGQLGGGAFGNSEILSQRVVGLEDKQVVRLASAGPRANHSCALTESGALYCWGAGTSGQIGDGGAMNQPLATRVAGVEPYVAASTSFDPESGSGHTCGVTLSGDLLCWGDRPGGPGSIDSPADVASGNFEPTISAGSAHVCVTDVVGIASCFGLEANGRLGNGNARAEQFAAVPQPVIGIENQMMVAAGSDFTVALSSDGHVYSWGSNERGQLGQSSDVPQNAVPSRVVFSTDSIQ